MLNELLEKIVDKQRERDQLEAKVKALDRELDALEGIAAEQLAASGLQGVRAAGKSWWIEDTPYLSVPADNREKVMEAAAVEGCAEELATVSTTTLKSILVERAKKAGKMDRPLAEGTAFEGLVSEFRKVRLRGRANG